jgi:hypothetical protein
MTPSDPYGNYRNNKSYVKDATTACRDQGCRAPELAALARHVSEQARETLDILDKKGTQMQPTQALWCEQGGHSFSEKDPDVQVIAITARGPDGQQMTESRTSCGECAAAAKTRLGKARNRQAAELSPGGE